MGRKRIASLTHTQPEGICGKCGQPTLTCLWDGVQGWICAGCGYFWSVVKQEQAPPEAGDPEEDSPMKEKKPC